MLCRASSSSVVEVLSLVTLLTPSVSWQRTAAEPVG